jgi:tRNA pseudouridine38-40 synthase
MNIQGSDLRSLHSVEGKIRLALSSLADGLKPDFTQGIDPEVLWNGCNYENFQVSSRTDRSVHALKNTFHVDLRTKDGDRNAIWDTQKLIRGLNFHLIRNARDEVSKYLKDCSGKMPQSLMRLPENDVRITSCRPAPLELLPNKHFAEGAEDIDMNAGQPSHISWNARFTATSRTYVYRILCHRLPLGQESDGHVEEYGFPFEAGRSWRMYSTNDLDVEAMRTAANHLVGTHDFSSFRGKKCYRSTPVTTIDNISIESGPLFNSFAIIGRNEGGRERTYDNKAQIVSIAVKGNAFLYRQVRNMVGCLADVGQKKLCPSTVQEILMAKDRRKAPAMAPAHGLYLANVEHGDFYI